MSGGIQIPPGFRLERDPLAGIQIPPGFKLEGPNELEDFGRGAAAGLGRGLIGIPGAPADIGSLVQAGVDWGARKITGKSQDELDAGRPMAIPREEMERFSTEGMTKRIAKNADLPFLTYEPQTKLGKYGKVVAEAVPNMVAGQGSLARRAITQTLLPAMGGEAAAEALEGTGYEGAGRVAGMVAGAQAPRVAARVVTPNPARADLTAAGNRLRGEGVTDLTAGQRTGSHALSHFEAENGGGRYANALENQGRQFTQAVMRRVGENADSATTQVVDRAFTRIGRDFDDLQSRSHTQLTPQLQNDLLNVVADYHANTGQAHVAPVVEQTMDRIAEVAARNGGTIPGPNYQRLRSQMEKVARETGQPETAHALRNLREVLDDAVEQGLSPQDIARWGQARRQYRNLLVVEDAVTRPGAETALGMISPKSLASAVKGQDKRRYARGQGDFAQLAHDAAATMTRPPNSGTPGRLAGLQGGALAGAGAYLGHTLMGGGEGAVAGAVGGFMAPRLAGRAAMNPIAQEFLANQLLIGSGLKKDARRAALSALLLQSN